MLCLSKICVPACFVTLKTLKTNLGDGEGGNEEGRVGSSPLSSSFPRCLVRAEPGRQSQCPLALAGTSPLELP